jgi:hypothetical protein
MDDHLDTASPREDNRLPGAGRVRRSDQEHAGDAARPGTSRPPRTVLHAVRLMYASGVVELSAVVTIVGTTGSVKSVVLGRNPGFTAEQWRATATLASHARAPGGRHPPGSPPEALAREVVMAPARLPRRGWRSTRNQTSGASC